MKFFGFYEPSAGPGRIMGAPVQQQLPELGDFRFPWSVDFTGVSAPAEHQQPHTLGYQLQQITNLQPGLRRSTIQYVSPPKKTAANKQVFGPQIGR